MWVRKGKFTKATPSGRTTQKEKKVKHEEKVFH